eukprot:PhF_6_TR19176/c0_g1_i1/m.28200/K00640/cysE; serine O-acetyltransferase
MDFTDVINSLSKPSTILEQVPSPVPSHEAIARFIQACRSVLLPEHSHEPNLNAEQIVQKYLPCVYAELQSLIECLFKLEGRKETVEEIKGIVSEFVRTLPVLQRKIELDVQAALNGDPATSSSVEVILAYPGINAIIHYRIAHQLYSQGLGLLIPRMISSKAHSESAIDIHPAAKIGDGLFIDHGTGVVVGGTAIIGNNVRMYHGVTLGAKAFPTDQQGKMIKGQPRHPILEDDVVIYAHATLLGRITVGKGAVIGGNVWVTNNVAPGASIVQAKSVKVPNLIDGEGI